MDYLLKQDRWSLLMVKLLIPKGGGKASFHGDPMFAPFLSLQKSFISWNVLSCAISLNISLSDVVEVLPFGLKVWNPVLSLLCEMKKTVVREKEDERWLHKGTSSLPISQDTLFRISWPPQGLPSWLCRLPQHWFWTCFMTEDAS